MFLLALSVAVPVPDRTRLASVPTLILSIPGDAASSCRSTSKFLPAANVMSPFRLTVSLPVPPLILREALREPRASTVTVSFPPSVLTTICVMPVTGTRTSFGSTEVAPGMRA